ncbi:MAG: type II and III secretion system protein family protein, partial [Janthinobacterium lividum]
MAPGRTSVAALDASGRTILLFDVTVQPGTYQATSIDGAASQGLPDAQMSATPTANGVALNGRVSNPGDAERAILIAGDALLSSQKLDNGLEVASSATVGLKVRITEMTRQVTRDLGVDWSALGTIGKYAIDFATTNGVATTLKSVYGVKGLTVDTVLEALASDNLVHVLAEPNLTARSGESASFLVGGEYPIPVAQASSGSSNTISVDYKQYGVSLSFVPTVLSSGRISLHVRPEVSELATSASAGAVTLAEGSGSLSIPALTVRRAETTVELGSGQSFAIAGLLQDSTTQANNYLPGLGQLPILGALFRSDSFQHNQTELVIIVTPYIVGSASDPDTLQDAGGSYTPPNDIERVLLLRQHGQARPTPVPGDAGFIIR